MLFVVLLVDFLLCCSLSVAKIYLFLFYCSKYALLINIFIKIVIFANNASKKRNIQMKVNYHTHSHYCDGKGELEEYVIAAIDKNFTHLGFSGHAPVPFENHFAIRSEQYLDYCNEVRSLQKKYSDIIKISLGLEIDYIPGIIDDFEPLVKEGNLDFCIGSIHSINKNRENDLWNIDGADWTKYDKGLAEVYDNDIRAGVKAFYDHTNEMIITQKPDIIGHFNKIEMNNKNRYFHADEKWYCKLVNETLDVIEKSGCICEINTRGIYKGRYPDFYPSTAILKLMKPRNIPVIVSTDAHLPSELDLEMDNAYRLLDEIGYKNIVLSI